MKSDEKLTIVTFFRLDWGRMIVALSILLSLAGGLIAAYIHSKPALEITENKNTGTYLLPDSRNK